MKSTAIHKPATESPQHAGTLRWDQWSDNITYTSIPHWAQCQDCLSVSKWVHQNGILHLCCTALCLFRLHDDALMSIYTTELCCGRLCDNQQWCEWCLISMFWMASCKNGHITCNGFQSGIQWTPEGRPGMSDVSPLSGISGLSFDSTLLSPLLFFCLVLLLFSCYPFLPAGPFFWTFSRNFFNIFR